MKKIYLVYKCTYDEKGMMTDNFVINVFSNKKKAESYKTYRYSIKDNDNEYFYIIDMTIEKFDYSD